MPPRDNAIVRLRPGQCLATPGNIDHHHAFAFPERFGTKSASCYALPCIPLRFGGYGRNVAVEPEPIQLKHNPLKSPARVRSAGSTTRHKSAGAIAKKGAIGKKDPASQPGIEQLTALFAKHGDRMASSRHLQKSHLEGRARHRRLQFVEAYDMPRLRSASLRGGETPEAFGGFSTSGLAPGSAMSAFGTAAGSVMAVDCAEQVAEEQEPPNSLAPDAMKFVDFNWVEELMLCTQERPALVPPARKALRRSLTVSSDVTDAGDDEETDVDPDSPVRQLVRSGGAWVDVKI